MTDETKDQPQETESDFEKAFGEFSGKDAPPDEGRDQEEPVEAEQSGADDDPPAEPDDAGPDQSDESLWTSAPPELKAAYEAAEKKAKELEHKIRSDDGRVATYQRQVDELRQQIAQLTRAEKTDAGNKDEDETDLDAELAEVMEEYPEVAKPFAKIIRQQQEHIKQLTQHHQSQVAQQTQAQLSANLEKLKEAHPDFVEHAASGKFREWVETQPRYIQEAAFRNAEAIVDPAEAIDLVERFKAAQGIESDPQRPQGTRNNITTRRQKQLESGASVPSRGVGAGSGPPDDFEAAFNHYARRG